ncbi:hypothetical protein Ancab_020449 [Ancistrocladus abbreviatus]
MKINKNKGKVHPSPSSSSSSLFCLSSSSTSKDSVSALKLLPAAILALISVLSLEDKEVLAYMITRSIKATANPSSLLEENIRKSRKIKKQPPSPHKSPLFDCGCFDCYTSYWFRWDSSPNRELIHQAIEAFEEHLASGELQSSKKANNRGKRRDRASGGRCLIAVQAAEEAPVSESVEPVVEAETVDAFLGAETPPGDAAEDCGGNGEDLEQKLEVEREDDKLAPAKEDAVGVVRSPADGNHKGLARKVLPDVIGLLNSRLWNLWNPNV